MVRVFMLFCMISLSGCSVVNTLRMKSANDDIVPLWAKAQSIQHFDATYIGHKPYITVNANGQDLLFLIDTGASFSILFDTEKGKNVSSTKGYELSVGGWGEGASTPAYQTVINTLMLGNITFSDVKVAYIPLSESHYYHTPQEARFDGVLGHDILRHFSWRFDKQSGVISASREPLLPIANHVAIPFTTFWGKLSIPASVHFNSEHQYEREVVIDTGSRHYFKLNTAFIKNNDITLPQTVSAADFGMNGKAMHHRFTLDKLVIGELTFNNVKSNVIKSDDEDDWWIIGSALINQYVSIIDYHTSQFALQPYENGVFRSQYNLSGLEIRKLIDGNFVVRHVADGFAAKDENIEVGDVITEINQIPAQSLSEEEWLSIANLDIPLSLCFESKRCVTLPMNHIDGYSNL